MRISDTLRIIQAQLENYDAINSVTIDNLVDNGEPVNHNDTVITLLKVEEEAALKNGEHARINQSYRVTYKNRKVYTNLYILISCHQGYETALTNLSMVIEFFQGKHIFTHLDGLPDGVNIDEKFRLIVELQDFTFEQINYIWSLYGGQHRPGVIYKIRLLPHEARDKKHREGEPILNIQLQGNSTL